MLIWAWVLIVLVKADGVEREWNAYSRANECIEALQIVTHYHEEQIQARCEYRQIDTAKQREPK